jgi:predicted kinase
MKQHVQILVGMIASGKSTYARNAAKAGFVVVNDDSISESIQGGDYGLYDRSLKPLYKSTASHIAHTALALGRSVVIDTGSRSRTTRMRWTTLAKSLDVPIIAITFPFTTPNEHALRRYNADSRGYSLEQWQAVAERHWQDWEPVGDDEGFNNIVYEEWESVRSGLVYDPESQHRFALAVK